MRTTVAISEANNYIRVFDFHPEFVKRVIMPFCRMHLFKTARVPIPGTRETRWEVSHVFARFNKDKTEFRIIKGLLKEFVAFIESQNYHQKRIARFKEPELLGKDVDFTFNEGWDQPREHQYDWLKYQLDDGPLKINNAKTGDGKAQTLDSLIRIPTGWKRMGDMKVGDEVIAWDGSTSKVMGVHPQGITPVRRVNFIDGRSTKVNPEHLWDVFIDESSERQTVATQDLEKLLADGKKIRIPNIIPEQRLPSEHKIDPYFVGILLTGYLDGQGNVIVKLVEDGVRQRFFNLKPKHIQVDDLGNMTYRIVGRNPNPVLRVPKSYMETNICSRIRLLAGFLDVKGRTYKDSGAYACSNSKELLGDIQYLIWSLGGEARIEYVEEGRFYKLLYKPGHGICYNFSVSKAVNSYKFEGSNGVEITSITKEPDQETQCIGIDHPDHLYVTDGFIVTHNTYMGIYSMAKIGKRTGIFLQPRYIPVWLKDLGQVLKLKPEDIYICEVDLLTVAEQIEKGILNPKIIIIPMTRIEVSLRKEKEVDGYPNLDTIFKMMDFGLRIQDEAHEAIHQVYISFLYGNVPKIIACSATMKSDDPYTNKVYRWIYPLEHRLKETEYSQYIDVIAYKYYIDMYKYKLQTQSFGSYSDVTFEKSVYRNNRVMSFYYQLVKKAFEAYYMSRRRDKTKCLIFFSKVDVCERICKMLKEDYPDLDIVTFTGADTKKAESKTKYKEHEIVISTPGSCGTGKDIPGLITTLCLHNVSSRQRNDQILGRLRDVKKLFPDLDPIFVYFYCSSIKKHVEYHEKRWALFEPKAKSRTHIESEMFLN